MAGSGTDARLGTQGAAAFLLLTGVCVLGLVAPTWAQAPGTRRTPATPLVRVPFSQDDGTLTPYTFEVGYQLMTLVYDTLLWRDEHGVPQPWLARSVEPSPDGRRVTVRLDPRARWHDGAPVTAVDVAFTFRFVADRLHPRFTPQLRAVERVDVANPATAVVILRHRSPGFLDQPLADLPILPAHVWQNLPRSQAAPEGLPVGSGPYRLVEHRAEERYRFEAFTDYFRGPPAVAAIEVPIIRSFDQTVRALKRHEVDMIPVSLPEMWKDELGSPVTRVRQGPSYGGTVLMFNLRRPPFDNAGVRQAVARSIDVGGIARSVGGAAAAKRGYLHPASPWAPPDVDGDGGRGGPLDLRALALPPLEVLVAENDPVKVAAAREVVRGLRKAGAEAKVTSVPYKALADAIGENGGEPSFSAAIWTTPVLTSYEPDFLRAVFGSDPRQGVLNYGGYRSAAFDAAAERVATTADRAARKAAVADQLRVLAEELPVVPLFFARGSFAYRPAVYDGWRFVQGTGLFDKRSFTEPIAARAPRPDDTPPQSSTSSGMSPLGWTAVAIAAAAAVLVLTGVVRARR